jgi:hypothetical protein
MGTVESLVRFYPEIALSGAVLAVILIDLMVRAGSIVPGSWRSSARSWRSC